MLTAVHNSADHVCAALESILGQTFADLELIVVDDASTDGTSPILRSFDDGRIVRLHNPERLGLTRSLNRALGIARGDWIARMDGDDVAERERLERQCAYLDDHPEIGILGSGFTTIDAGGRRLAEYCQPADHAAIMWQMLFHNAFCHSSVLVRRELCEAVGGYDEALEFSQDYDLWDRVLRRARGANLEQSLVRLRQHGASISASRTAEQQRIATALARRGMERLLGPATPGIDEVARLRDWYYAQPEIDSIDELRLFHKIFDLIDAFTDHEGARPTRAFVVGLRQRWAARLLAATPPRLWRQLWPTGLLSWILRSAPLALPKHMAKSIVRPPTRIREAVG